MTRTAQRVARRGRRPAAASWLAIGYGVYLLHGYAAGTLYYYIHPMYAVPAAVSGGILVALGVAGWRGAHVGQAAAGLLALPLAAGFLLPAEPLGVGAVPQRGLEAARVSGLDEGPSFALAVDPATYTIKDWIKAFQAEPEPTVHAGKPVRVTGFVYHDARLPAETFLVARFVVQCCAVDAQPVGLLVRAAGAASFEAGAWVAVEGVMEVGQVDGRRRAVVSASAVAPTSRPDQPYLY